MNLYTKVVRFSLCLEG